MTLEHIPTYLKARPGSSLGEIFEHPTPPHDREEQPHGAAPRIDGFMVIRMESLLSLALAYRSGIDRDNYLARYFPERRTTDIPGVLSVAGGYISLYGNIILFHDELAVIMGLVPDNAMESA